MPSFRRAIPDFQLANPLYVGAQVFIYQVDDNGQATDTLATLYAAPRGPQTISNPIILDGEGKFARVPYIAGAVIMTVISATVGSHQTGIVMPIGTWRDFWAANTHYVTNDFIAYGDPDFPTIYAASAPFLSREFIADDIAAGDLVKIFDAGLVRAARDDAEESVRTIALMKDTIAGLADQVNDQHQISTQAYTQFRNVYYGAYPERPETRPDGTPPQDGDTFLRTTTPQGLHYWLDGDWAVPSSDTETLNNKLDKTHEGAGGTTRHPLVTPHLDEDPPGLAGFMSPEDKAKLDTVEQGANAYTHPVGPGNEHVPAVGTGDVGKWLKAPTVAGESPKWNTIGKADVGLGSVDNTRDQDKPISMAQQAGLDKKLDKFAAGTQMLFVQTAAPTGWTKVTTHNDKALRVVSGTAGSGGTVGFNTGLKSYTVTGTVGNTTLSVSQMPVHDHDIPMVTSNFQGTQVLAGQSGPSPYKASTATAGGGSSHGHSFSGGTINLDIAYVDAIIAKKD